MPAAGEAAIVAPVIAHVRLTTPQLSVTTATGVITDALHTPAEVFVAIGAGQLVKTGASLSETVTLKEHVAVLPDASLAV